jgi:GT2 family glycosyltransferase
MTATVFAVVLNWRDVERTLRCVEGLASLSEIDHVVLVDNETQRDPRLLTMAQQPKCTLILSEENEGFARGVNRGIAEARAAGAKFILLVNNDARVDGKAVNLMSSSLQSNQDIGGVAPRITFPDGRLQAFGGGNVRPVLGDAPTTVHERSAVDYLTGAVSMYRESALSMVNDFDGRFFMYWEDVDLGLRLRKAGWRLSVVAQATATHELSASRSRAGSRLVTYYWESLLRFTIKWGGLWWIGATLRLIGAVAARVLAVRPRSELPALWRGVRRGLSLKSSGGGPIR